MLKNAPVATMTRREHFRLGKIMAKIPHDVIADKRREAKSEEDREIS
jgi:hypothetical protein